MIERSNVGSPWFSHGSSFGALEEVNPHQVGAEPIVYPNNAHGLMRLRRQHSTTRQQQDDAVWFHPYHPIEIEFTPLPGSISERR